MFRGCVDEAETSPWDDGKWEYKDRCKTKDGIKTCTCKDEKMCNGAVRESAVAAGVMVALLMVGRSVL